MDISTLMLLTFILVLSIFLGFEVISKVPAILHTPLMSGSNAISGITLVGAMICSGEGLAPLSTILGIISVVLATINVVGGYLVTHRMLGMFQKKEEK
ncbi:MAG TPA: NAD(P) transhydrogenase subunit alpha [Chlamydiales bacterium]|nr:NAD(P) transhydrogenase subunit alpha [Chlamydiales bacterium]